MPKIEFIKMPWQTKYFKEGQKVFIKKVTGSEAFLVTGKFRAKGKRIDTWLKWNNSNAHLIKINEIDIDQESYDKIIRQT